MVYGTTGSSLAPAITTINEQISTSGNPTAGANRSSFYGRLKDMYLPAWDDHVHTGTKIGKVLAKKKGTMGGRRMLGSVLNNLPQSAGIAMLEYDDLPTPSASSHFQPQLIARNLFSRLRWSLQVQNAARAGDKAAWAEPQREDIEGAKKQFEINFERMMFLGNRDVLATVSTDGTQVHALTSRNSRTSAANTRWAFGSHYLRNNMAIALVEDSTNNVVVHQGTLDEPSVPGTNIRFASGVAANAVTTSSTVGSATAADWSTGGAGDAGALIVPWGSRRIAADQSSTEAAGHDSLFSAMNGLGNLAVSNSEIAYVYGLLRTSYDSLNARMFQNGGTVRPFDERFISLAIDKIADDGKGDEPDHMHMHSSVRREYVRETQGDRRFEPIQQGKGYKKLAFTANDVMLAVETSRDCPPGSVFILDTSTFGYFEESPMHMVDDGPRFVANKAAQEIVLAKSGNVACIAPFNNGVIEDIAFDVDALTA